MEQVGMFIFGTQNHLIPYFVGVILGLLLLRKKPLQISAVSLNSFPVYILSH